MSFLVSGNTQGLVFPFLVKNKRPDIGNLFSLCNEIKFRNFRKNISFLNLINIMDKGKKDAQKSNNARTKNQNKLTDFCGKVCPPSQGKREIYKYHISDMDSNRKPN
jgi:hypothetical protein